MKKSIMFITLVIVSLFVYGVSSVQARSKFSNEPIEVQQTLHDLCEFGSFSEVKDAIIAGQDVNGQDDQGRTPLMAACQGNSSVEMMQLLLSYGARVNLTDNKGRTAFMYAAQYDSYEKVFRELIKAGALVNVKANDGTTALMLACENTDTPSIVSLIIDAGADVNARDYDGYCPLDYAKNNERFSEMIKDILVNAGAKGSKKK
ncbi:MAG: ankyrin repeat domain-containing protein [Endomicrobiaceae bacterium]|nr:ankyrin repeat domain-containing protein [Endomicrobiaceae bacterium]